MQTAPFTLTVLIAGFALAADPPTTSTAPASQPATGPRYRCDEPVYKLQNVWSGDKVNHTFVIRNEGTTPLTITDVQAACGCFVANDYTHVIAPGQKGTIDVSLQTARQSKEVHKEMEVQTDDPLHAKNLLVMEGKITPRVEIEPMFGANWNRLYPGNSLTKTVKLTNHFTRPMKLEIKATDTHPDYDVVLKEVKPGQLADLVVTARKDLSQGAHTGFVHLKTGFAEEPEMQIPCTLFVPPEFEVIPIAFSVYAAAGDVDRQTLMLRWNGPAPMKIESAVPSEGGIDTELKEKEPGRMYHVVITIPTGYVPPDSGEVQIVLKTDLKDRAEIKIPIRPRKLPSITSRPSRD